MAAFNHRMSDNLALKALYVAQVMGQSRTELINEATAAHIQQLMDQNTDLAQHVRLRLRYQKGRDNA